MIRRQGKVVVICGGGSGSGKTALAEALLARLPGWAAMKITPTDLYSGIVVEKEWGTGSDKDTARFSRAGAAPVLHVRACRDELEEVLREALSHLSPEQPVLIEGLSAIAELRADLTVFVWKPDVERPKDNAMSAAATADIVVVNRDCHGEAGSAGVTERAWPHALLGCLAPGKAEQTAGDVLERFRQRGIS